MNARRTVVCGLVWIVAIARAAQADLTAFWQNNSVTPQAIADDPALASMQSWSVMVTNTDGFFASAGLRAVLPVGNNFYRNPLGGDTRPGAAAMVGHPALVFHTYVTAPRQSPSGLNYPVILGGFPQGEQLSFGGQLDSIPGTFSVSWGDIDPNSWPPATYEIVRLTFANDVLPTIHPQSVTFYVHPSQSVLLPIVIPEPATSCVVLVAAPCWLGLCRLRREMGRSISLPATGT